jgi:hypothetical protein
MRGPRQWANGTGFGDETPNGPVWSTSNGGGYGPFLRNQLAHPLGIALESLNLTS